MLLTGHNTVCTILALLVNFNLPECLYLEEDWAWHHEISLCVLSFSKHHYWMVQKTVQIKIYCRSSAHSIGNPWNCVTLIIFCCVCGYWWLLILIWVKVKQETKEYADHKASLQIMDSRLYSTLYWYFVLYCSLKLPLWR